MSSQDRAYAALATHPPQHPVTSLLLKTCSTYIITLPTIFMHLFMRGYSYGLAWISTIYGIVWGVAAGAIVGAIYKKVSA
jgi:hypothetical protein